MCVVVGKHGNPVGIVVLIAEFVPSYLSIYGLELKKRKEKKEWLYVQLCW